MTGNGDLREPCSQWPPAGCCARCHGDGGWYKRLGAVDWDWTTCQECGGTGDSEAVRRRTAQGAAARDGGKGS